MDKKKNKSSGVHSDSSESESHEERGSASNRKTRSTRATPLYEISFSPRTHSTQMRLEKGSSDDDESSAVDDIEAILKDYEVGPSRSRPKSTAYSVISSRSNSSPAPGTSRRSKSIPAKTPRPATVGKKKTTPRKGSQPAKSSGNVPIASGSAAPSNRRQPRKQQVPKKREGPGTGTQELNALNEIIKYQQATNNLIPKLSFGRVIRELLMKYSTSGRSLYITAEALEALQESAEMYLVQLFEDSYLCSMHRDRVTLIVKDMRLAMELRKRFGT